MIQCACCGKMFTPRHGNQKKCKSCRTREMNKPKADRKKAGELRKRFGTGKSSNWKCKVFPNCERCPFPDCIDNSSRMFVSEVEE